MSEVKKINVSVPEGRYLSTIHLGSFCLLIFEIKEPLSETSLFWIIFIRIRLKKLLGRHFLANRKTKKQQGFYLKISKSRTINRTLKVNLTQKIFQQKKLYRTWHLRKFESFWVLSNLGGKNKLMSFRFWRTFRKSTPIKPTISIWEHYWSIQCSLMLFWQDGTDI